MLSSHGLIIIICHHHLHKALVNMANNIRPQCERERENFNVKNHVTVTITAVSKHVTTENMNGEKFKSDNRKNVLKKMIFTTVSLFLCGPCLSTSDKNMFLSEICMNTIMIKLR